MLNFAIDPRVLQPLVPTGTELDVFEGQHFVSLVGFRFLNTRIRGWAIPWHRQFDEVNLRFYVRAQVAGAWRRGVVFIKEVVPLPAVAWVANTLYNERYVTCAMQSEVKPASSNKTGSVHYRWRQARAWYELNAEFQGEAQPLIPGSEPEFIAEHYYGYTRQRDGSTLEYRVEHPPWKFWPAEAPGFTCDVARFYGAEFAPALSQPMHSAFVAHGSEVTVYEGRRLS